MPADRWLRALLRFLVVAVLATGLSLACQDRIVDGLLPLFRAWLDLVDDTYRTIDLSLVNTHGESMLRRLVTPAHLQLVGGAMVYPDPARQFLEQAATGIVLQPLILAIALLVAWPWSSVRELFFRYFVAPLPMTCVMLLDVPMMLYGFAWFDQLKAVNSDRFSLLVCWADAMNAGGRFGLALIAVRLCVCMGAAARARAPAMLAPRKINAGA